ncbi:membrane protein [Pseudonocardia yunnanensis]|uniref:DUF2269 domain-containing protein n=1 Tax=Pseudonocardia yunnanensis TaxID=58107 RepID=A0ABW4F115_9PSEU
MSAPSVTPVGRAPVTRVRVRLTGRRRRVLRAVHVAVGVGWLGLACAMLTLGLSAALTREPGLAGAAYTLMGYVGTRTIAGMAIATLISGLVLSLVTPWGLVRHWWVVVKTVLTLVVIVSAVGITNGWVERAAAAADDPGGPAAWLVVTGSAGHLLLLAAATLISVDKPWGRIRKEQR